MKFNAQQDLQNYSNESSGYFSLKNDGDTCRVRFMYNSLDDVEGYCVHRVKDKYGNYRSVDCLREYGDPLETCPCCSSPNMADRKTITKFYIPMYKVDDEEAVIWDRGKKMYKQLSTLMVEKGSPFCSNTFIIERNGAAGDENTTYEIIHDGTDDTTLEDLLEEVDMPTPENGMLLKLTFDEMKNFVENRTFNPSSDTENDGVRRRDRSEDVPRRRGTTRPDIS